MVKTKKIIAKNIKKDLLNKKSLSTNKTNNNNKNIKKSNNKKDILSNIKNIRELVRIYDLPHEHLTPILILRKQAEILELYLKVLQGIIQPEEFHSLYEVSAFTDDDKAELMDLFREVMILHRDCLKVEILSNDIKTIETINKVHLEICDLKLKMYDVVLKMQNSWKSKQKKDNQRYFG